MLIRESKIRQIVRSRLRILRESNNYSGVLPAGLSVDDIAFLTIAYRIPGVGWLHSPSTGGVDVPEDGLPDLAFLRQRMSAYSVDAIRLILDISAARRGMLGGMQPTIYQVGEFLSTLSDSYETTEVARTMRRLIGRDGLKDLVNGLYEDAICSIAPPGFSEIIDRKRVDNYDFSGNERFRWGSNYHVPWIHSFASSVELIGLSLDEVERTREIIDLGGELMALMPGVSEEYRQKIGELALSSIEGMQQAVEIARSLSMPDEI